MSDWQLIETAPDIMGVILAWGKDFPFPCAVARDEFGECYCPITGAIFYLEASHWMPLPAPPTDREAD